MSATKPQAEQIAYTRNQLVSSLLKIGHGDLSLYTEPGLAAAKADPELFGHLIAWNAQKGKVRDSKVAFPPLALRGLGKQDRDLAESAIAHMLQLSPRDLVRCYRFSRQLTQSNVITSLGVRDFNAAMTWAEIMALSSLTTEEKSLLNPEKEMDRRIILQTANVKVHSFPMGIPASWRRLMESAIKQYLSVREQNRKWFDRTVLQHRRSMNFLYQLAHKKPSDYARLILSSETSYPKGSIFAKVASLKGMSAQEAAGTILEYDIPFEVAVGAVAKAKDKDIVLALIEGMSGTQLITNTQMLQRLGVMTDSVLKSAYEDAIKRAKGDKSTETLKAGRAAEAVKGTAQAGMLSDLQAAKTKQLGDIRGDWLILGDRSGSMREAIDLARKIAALIAERVSGRVILVFFDHMPTPMFEVSGKTYDQILEETRRYGPGGSTSIGCGVDYLREKGVVVNGIAIASDGGDNANPRFPEAYQRYCKEMEVEPTVYLFRTRGDANELSRECKMAKIALEEFDMTGQVDYYSLPQIVSTLRTSRYALFDDIMETPLLTIQQALDGQKERRGIA